MSLLYIFRRDDLGRLPYLALCIKESMRLHTPVPIVGRQVDTEFEIEGVTLPIGTLIDVHIHQMHNNKAVWGEDCHVCIFTDLVICTHLKLCLADVIHNFN